MSRYSGISAEERERLQQLPAVSNGEKAKNPYAAKFTPAKQQRYFACLAEGWSKTRASAAAGVNASTIAYHRKTNPEFVEQEFEATQRGTDRIEDEATRRAVEGVAEPVYQGGQLVGEVQRYSDQLMGLLLRGRRPERYKDRVEQSGNVVLTDQMSDRKLAMGLLFLLGGQVNEPLARLLEQPDDQSSESSPPAGDQAHSVTEGGR